MKIFIIICAVILSFVAITTEQSLCNENQPKNIEINGVIELKQKFRNKSGHQTYRLVVETVPYSDYKGKKKKEQELIGWDVGPTIEIVKSIKFRLIDFSMEFPKNSYDDLCRVHIRLEVYNPVVLRGDQIIITLSGGDASSYFKVRYMLDIKKDTIKLKRREVMVYPPWDFSSPDDIKIF